MGNDGGSIPGRQDLVKSKKRPCDGTRIVKSLPEERKYNNGTEGRAEEPPCVFDHVHNV